MFNTEWYRVVCDEAQFIRNRLTRCSAAVSMLRAKYRWCLTGTPVINTLFVSSTQLLAHWLTFACRTDIYGYLRFGHFGPYKYDTYLYNEQL